MPLTGSPSQPQAETWNNSDGEDFGFFLQHILSALATDRATQQGFRLTDAGFDLLPAWEFLAFRGLEQHEDVGSRLASFRLQQHWPEVFSSSPHWQPEVGFPQFPMGTPTVETTNAKSVTTLQRQRREGILRVYRERNTATSFEGQRANRGLS